MEKLIDKYLNETINQEEYERLVEALKDPKQRKIFEKHFQDHYHVLRALTNPDKAEAYDKVWKYISLGEENHPVNKPHEFSSGHSQNRGRIIKYNWYGYAAAIAFALVMALGYLYWQDSGVTISQDFADLIPAQDDIVLELGNGSQKVIQPGDEKEIVDGRGQIIGHQDQDRLDFSGEIAMTQGDVPLYNTLTVPYGKRLDIRLADGTKIYLQSGTSLRFPSRFDGQEFRNVEVEGEAFFEVAKDTEHPFIVETRGLKVRVTGTQFNVTAYPEDATTDIVLVEGGVQLLTDEHQPKVDISPGEKGSLIRKSNEIDREWVNTDLYTSWIKGSLVFRQMSFDQIEKKLERYYNIEIINVNKDLGQTVFNAHFKNESITNVLSFFRESFDLTYSFRDNRVYIN